MTSTFRATELNRLRQQFDTLVDDILTREKDSEDLESFEINLITAFNAIVRYGSTDYHKRHQSTKTLICDTILECRTGLKKCAEKLNIRVLLPTLLLSPISTSDFPARPKPEPAPHVPSKNQTEQINHENKLTTTTMGDFAYLTSVGSIIKKTYSGDPSGLSAFIEAIELASELSQDGQIPTLIRFIKTKCDKIAKEAIDEINPAPTTVAQIVTALRNKIKVDNSKVVVGRLLALKADKTSVQNFQEKGEELAEKLRLAYISEGIPATVAKTMVIDKTVEMCRSSAKTQLIKSVLASTKFDEPKEVLAKFVVEISSENREVKEAQVLKFSNNRGRGRGNRNFNYNSRGNYQNNRGNYYNNNNRGNYHNNRGRGNYHNNRGNNRGRNDRNGRQVYMVQENGEAPTQERGSSNQNSVLTLRQVSQQQN